MLNLKLDVIHMGVSESFLFPHMLFDPQFPWSSDASCLVLDYSLIRHVLKPSLPFFLNQANQLKRQRTVHITSSHSSQLYIAATFRN